MKITEKICKYAILSISFFFLFIFSWMSVISTSTVTLMEHVYFTDISGVPGILVFFFLIIISLVPAIRDRVSDIEKKLSQNTKLYRTLYFMLAGILLLISILWVTVTGFESWADSRYVQDSVRAFVAGIYDPFRPDGYIGYYHNQIGLVLLEAPVFMIFGENAPMVFQLFNACCIPLILTALTRFDSSRLHKLIILSVGIVWFPIFFTASHIYGNIPGLMLAAWSYVFLADFVEKPSFVKGLSAAVLIGMSCIVKQNYLIFLISFVLVSGLETMRKKKLYPVLIGIVAIIFSILFSKGAVSVLESITGFEITGGESKWSYIAMGMQEGSRASGWWNGYNEDTYIAACFDTEAQAEISRAEIKNRMHSMIEHPAYALNFYTMKLASQWNEPSFQSIWLLRSHSEDMPAFIERLTSIGGSDRLIPYLKVFEVLIYLSALLFVCFEEKNDAGTELLLITFLGGVLFHIIWEAKSQYALAYFILLIPVAVRGMGKFIGYLRSRNKKSGKHAGTDRKKVVLGVTLMITLLFIGVLYYKHIPEGLRADTAEYQEYIISNS